MAQDKFQKYSWAIVLSFILSVTFQYFNSSPHKFLSEQGFDKFSELNQKYAVNSIESLAGSKLGSADSFASLLQTSILNSNQDTAQTLPNDNSSKSDKKLLFKLKNQENNLESILSINLPNESQNLEKIAAEYKANIAEIEFIEPDYEVTIAEDYTDIEKANGSYLLTQALSVENVTQETLTIAVVDTGADILHPLLRDHRWQNEKEIRNNSEDDDYNSLTDDKYGWDFINNSARVYVDNSGHGTHVSGLIAKENKNALILPIKVIDEKKGNLSNVIKGIKYAIDNDADIINFSIGTTQKSEALSTAINEALNKGIILVAAAGNSGDKTPYYPAAYDKVISVGATNDKGEKLAKSNYGDWVNIYATGQNLLSSSPGNKYEYKSGTSQAAAVITAAVSKIKTEQPYLNQKGILSKLQKEFTSKPQQ